MSDGGPSVIQFSVIESMSFDLRMRLAQRVEELLGVRHVSDVPSWLYAVATRDDLPTELRETFDGIAALASEDGADVLLSAGVDRDVYLAERYGAQCAADLAILACLDHPEVFADARSQLRAVNRRLFAVYISGKPLTLSEPQLSKKMSWIEEQVSAWLRSRGRHHACRAVLTESGSQLVVDIVTNQVPNRCLTSNGEEVIAYARRQDTIVFDRTGGCISIHARGQSAIDFYRALAGRLIFDDSQAYSITRVFDLRRLLSLSQWESQQAKIAGLVKVVLRGVELKNGSQRTRWRGDADQLPSRKIITELCENAEQCTRVELELHTDERAYPCTVEINPPNRICLDQRAVGSLASQYLKARGLFVAA